MLEKNRKNAVLTRIVEANEYHKVRARLTDKADEIACEEFSPIPRYRNDNFSWKSCCLNEVIGTML